jgi:hypothetical protein
MTLAAAVVAAAAFLTPVSAAPLASQTNLAHAAKTDSGLVTQAHYRRHHHRVHHRHFRRHRFWRHRCAARWGVGTRAYYRCLRRHR